MGFISLDMSTTAVGWAYYNDNEDLSNYGLLLPTDKKAEWRDRVKDLIPQINKLIQTYKPTKIVIEDVPLFKKGGLLTLVQLGTMQGGLLALCSYKDIELEFLTVGNWRKHISLHDGTQAGKERDALKIASIKKANQLFNLDLEIEYTKSGNYKPNGNDDISDAILIGASIINKYCVVKRLGRKCKNIS